MDDILIMTKESKRCINPQERKGIEVATAAKEYNVGPREVEQERCRSDSSGSFRSSGSAARRVG